jgi:hypothetical protein
MKSALAPVFAVKMYSAIFYDMCDRAPKDLHTSASPNCAGEEHGVSVPVDGVRAISKCEAWPFIHQTPSSWSHFVVRPSCLSTVPYQKGHLLLMTGFGASRYRSRLEIEIVGVDCIDGMLSHSNISNSRIESSGNKVAKKSEVVMCTTLHHCTYKSISPIWPTMICS